MRNFVIFAYTIISRRMCLPAGGGIPREGDVLSTRPLMIGKHRALLSDRKGAIAVAGGGSF